MSATLDSIDPEKVFLFTHGKQVGPLGLKEAEHFWKKQGAPSETFFWSPGMDDWKPVEEFFNTQDSKTEKTSPQILTVDDDPIMLEIIRLTLDQAGYRYQVADDMLPACQILEKEGLESFSCIVTDYNMPGGTGLDLIRWIKQRDDSLQTLLLTARDDKKLVKEGLRAGIFDFLEKPLLQDRFLSAVKDAISQTAQRREERAAFLEMVRYRLSGEGSLAEEVITTLAGRESHSGSIMNKIDTIIQLSRNLEDSGSIPNHMTGELGAVNMFDLVQLFCQSGKTGCLQITGTSSENNDKARLWFDKGRITSANTQDSTGIEALRALLRFQKGSFTFLNGNLPKTHNILGDSTSLLLMISAEIDKEREAN